MCKQKAVHTQTLVLAAPTVGQLNSKIITVKHLDVIHVLKITDDCQTASDFTKIVSKCLEH